MDLPAVAREEFLRRLRDSFFQVVPIKYQTYCVLTAQIIRRVLHQFGLAAELVPCQLWWAGPQGNFVVGFFQKQREEQWGGHVVCMTEGWLIDAAVHHVAKGMNVEVPSIALAPTFGIPSNVIGRLDLDAQTRLWWHQPPREVATVALPREPEDLIAMYSDELVARLRLEFAARATVEGATMASDSRQRG